MLYTSTSSTRKYSTKPVFIAKRTRMNHTVSPEKTKKSAGNADNTPRSVASRFGEITIDPAKRVSFPFGIVGLPQSLQFVLVDIPKQNMGRFKMLQSLDDDAFSFVVLPVDVQNSFIDNDDISTMVEALNIKPENLLLLLIASVRRNIDGTSSVSVNARAPIAIDTDDKAGIQYVFPHNKYDICTPLMAKKDA